MGSGWGFLFGKRVSADKNFEIRTSIPADPENVSRYSGTGLFVTTAIFFLSEFLKHFPDCGIGAAYAARNGARWNFLRNLDGLVQQKAPVLQATIFCTSFPHAIADKRRHFPFQS